MIDLLLLFCIGVIHSFCGVLIGSVLPLYLLIMQMLFPSLGLGNVIALAKCSGIAGGFGSLRSFWKDIDFQFLKKNAFLFLGGSIIGSFLISVMSNYWMLPLLIFAFFISEFAEIISKHLPKKMLTFLEFGIGVYAGMFGASAKAVLISLFRVKEPDDEKIIFLRIQISPLLLFSSLIGIITLLFTNIIKWEFAIPLMIGSLLGGLVAGKLTQKMQKLSGEIQKNIMRGSLLFGIIMSAWMIF